MRNLRGSLECHKYTMVAKSLKLDPCLLTSIASRKCSGNRRCLRRVAMRFTVEKDRSTVAVPRGAHMIRHAISIPMAVLCAFDNWCFNNL